MLKAGLNIAFAEASDKVRNPKRMPNIANLHFDAITYNVRSLVDIQKRCRLKAWIENMKPSMLLLQETWHTDVAPLHIAGYHTFISPPNDARSKGVMTIVSKLFKRVQPILVDLWTPELIVNIITIEDFLPKLILVNFYAEVVDSKKASSDTAFKNVIHYLKQLHPQDFILVGGDLNRSSKKVDILAAEVNLEKADHGEDDYSRAQCGSPKALLDYFISNMGKNHSEIIYKKNDGKISLDTRLSIIQKKQETLHQFNLADFSDHIPVKLQFTFSAGHNNDRDDHGLVISSQDEVGTPN